MKDTSKAKSSAENMTDPQLWDRIRIAPLPLSAARNEFHEALAYQIDLPIFEAREVVEEYRRFLYLAVTTDEHRVPSEPVRKAWAMHAHSPEYADFCAGVLKAQLAFDDGSRRFGANAAYRRTVEAYVREFRQLPPAAIWPPAIQVRVPRWLTAHAAVLGFTGVVAWESGEPLNLAIGVSLSLAIYGLDLYGAHLSAQRRGLGADVSDDLAYFLSESDAR